nr:shikimate dehydrogenase [Amorphus orientalis]
MLIGLLGRNIGRSRTPRMHLAAAEGLGLPYEYRILDAHQEGLPETAAEILDLLEAEGFNGINVTYPYKRAVVSLMDELSPAVQAVGAVNTVVFREGRRFGHNTDYWGFGESLRRGLPEAKRDTVLLVGAGGAGAAVSHALIDAGVGRLLVYDLQVDTAQALVAALENHAGPGRAEVASDPADVMTTVDGVVNASPVGMDAHPGIPVPVDALRPDHWVADIIYFPLETELLATARRLGCAVLPGSGMALFQAVRAFELFTGRKPDIERMRASFDSFS